MVPSRPPTPLGGGQSILPSLLRSNSEMLRVQGGQMPSQTTFSSLVSSHAQFGNVNLPGNASNMSSLLDQSCGNGGPNSTLLGSGHQVSDSGAGPYPLSSVGNGINFNGPSTSFVPSGMVNPGSSGQSQMPQFSNLPNSQLLPDQQPGPQLENQNFQHGNLSMQSISNPQNAQRLQQQRRLHTIPGGLGGIGPVKLEAQMGNNDQQVQRSQLQSVTSLGPIKSEPQQLQSISSLSPVKMEPQHSDQSLFLQQQQQQQFIHMSRRSSQPAAAQINFLHQQRLMQLQQQQHQQQQLLKAMPQQRPQLPQQIQQQNLLLRSPVKSAYEPGMCARRLTYFIYQQQHRPEDNNIEFWRKFVSEYFAPHAKKRWCVSMYGSGRQTTGAFPQDVWRCGICNCRPGRGFEATVEVLPRLFKIKYESGMLEELLYVDMPHEYYNASGQIVLDYAKATQESVFEQLRVVRDGQLRIVFTPDLKICSWEFCSRRHEELIPRRLLIPQVNQLGTAAQRYQNAVQNASTNLSTPDLRNNCNLFVTSARQLAKALEVPLVNDLGYTKRYVRSLQISEVVNSMKDLIDYSRETGNGPIESLAKFTQRTSGSSGFNGQSQQTEQPVQLHHAVNQNGSSDPRSAQAASMQIAAASNCVASVNSPINPASTASSANAIVGLLRQNSMSSRQQNGLNNGSPVVGNLVQISSPFSSSTNPLAMPNPSFQSPTPSLNPASSGNSLSTRNSVAKGPMQQLMLSSEADPSDSQNSVQKIYEMMMSNQLNGASALVGINPLGSDVKNANGIMPNGVMTIPNGGHSLPGIVPANGGSAASVAGYGTTGGGLCQTAAANGIRSAIGSNTLMNGGIGMTSLAGDQSRNHQQGMGNQLLGAANGFNNLQYDWESSP